MRAVFTALICLSACASNAPGPMPAAPVIEQAEIETMSDGRCFSFAPSKVRTEQITEQVERTPDFVLENGVVLVPATFETRQIDIFVPEGDPIRFEVICPQNLSQDFVASVQRALQARGAYTGPVHGLLDERTQNAILVYQTSLGIRSSHIALKTARDMGLAR